MSADLYVILEHYEQLALCPGPRMAPRPGLVNSPVLGLHVDLLPTMRELEPPGEPLDSLTLGQNNNVILESRQQQSLQSPVFLLQHQFVCQE